MSLTKVKAFFLMACLVFLTCHGQNIVKNGDFSQVENGKIAGWEKPRFAKVEQIDGKPTLVLEGKYASVRQTVNFQPDWSTIHLSMRMRVTDVVVGDKSWKDARLVINYKDAAGKGVGGWPNVFHAKGTTDWIQCERDYEIPGGAVAMQIQPVMFGNSGKLEIQDLTFTVTETYKPGTKPVIIFKLDDVTSLSTKWKRCADFLQEQNVKASFGIIGFSLERDNTRLFDWIKDLDKRGVIEFWNHGYHNRSGKDKIGEFESDSTEKQLTALKRTQQLAKEKLGIEINAFGPHWSGTNQATVEALKQIPEIKSVFYYTAGSKGDWFVFKRYFDMEKPLFKPNFAYIKKQYESGGYKKPYLCFQGHANQWDDARFEEFKKIVLYFKEKGCTFMTATEYVEQVANK